MSIFSQFKTSKVLEQEGITVRFKANEDGTIPSFKIGRASRFNPIWMKTFEAKTRPFKRDIDEKVMSEKDAQNVNIEIFVEAVLLGWENIKDESGDNIKFTKENAKKLFEELPELYEKLNEKASDMANFLEANLKDDEKN